MLCVWARNGLHIGHLIRNLPNFIAPRDQLMRKDLTSVNCNDDYAYNILTISFVEKIADQSDYYSHSVRFMTALLDNHNTFAALDDT